MRRCSSMHLAAFAGALLIGTPLSAQSWPTENPVLRAIWKEGMDNSHAMQLMQVLSDSIGPRLMGSPQIKNGHDWLVATYKSWGVSARNEQYGTWKGWRRGPTHIDLTSPRVRTLEGTMLAWSPGTAGREVTGGTIILPQVADSNAFVAWLPQVKGKFVLVSMPQPTCRPDDNWQQFATPESFERMKAQRDSAVRAWRDRVAATGYALSLGTGSLGKRLEQAGAAGVIASLWSNGWGVNKVFFTRNERAPALDLSCEDYGLVFRLTQNNQGPMLRVRADAESQNDVPVFNTVAELKGTQKPNEYIILSAHFDSWDAGSGSTDNGTGSITMMEAMRILKTVYPNPKRTILVGHWSGEEEGLNGSRAFVADHQDIVKGLQALFNQDNGTGRIQNLSASGLVNASAHVAQWGAQLPQEIARFLNYSFPGAPAGGGSDNASFSCAGAPGFGLGSIGWDYGTYTWHTNRDTYDKVVPDELRNNATLTAMLAYLASEDPETVPRERRIFTPPLPTADGGGRGGRGGGGGRGGPPGPQTWPECQQPLRSWSQYTR